MVYEPVKMFHAVFAVVSYFGFVRLGAGRHHHISDHILGAVLKAASALHASAAATAHVDFR